MSRPKWDRVFWGIVFQSEAFQPPEAPKLLGNAWNDDRRYKRLPTEPSRPMLFETRQQARDWCRTTNASWVGFKWHVKPARVRELVEVL